jgi:hypothetical protein
MDKQSTPKPRPGSSSIADRAHKPLEQKLAEQQAEVAKWTAVASDPSLSPQAAAWARGIARSSAAAVKLYQKAKDWQDDNSDEAAPQTPPARTLSPGAQVGQDMLNRLFSPDSEES